MVEAYRPDNLREALSLAENGDKTILSGGTDLMVKKKRWSGVVPNFEKPVIFIGSISELKELKLEGDNLIIGAGCTFADLIESDIIPGFIKTASRNVASPAIRNIATIGGNICNASPAADILPPFYALEAILIVESANCRREIPVQNFVTGPAKTDLKPNEILTQIVLPAKTFNKAIYKKVGTRKATALSKLSFTGLAEIEDGYIKDIRMAFGAVAPTVVKSSELEEGLKGLSISEAVKMLPEILDGYSKIIKPIDDQRSTASYRKKVSLNLIEDFIKNNL